MQPLSIEPGATIGSLLRRQVLDALEARILLSHALQLSRVQLVTQSERVLTPQECGVVATLFARRLQGEPIAYILGEREFFGLPLHTTPDVLIPRPETELLVELALDRMPDKARILDMGTGSGAIAIAIAHTRSDSEVTALDASEAALVIAHRNAVRHEAPVRLLHSDWYGALGNEQFDMIVSNPPYIVAGDPHLSQGDLRFEPMDALTDHGDGLSAIRTIVKGAQPYLVPGGWILMEHGYDQAAKVRELLIRQGFRDVQSWQDLAGIERVTGGMR